MSELNIKIFIVLNSLHIVYKRNEINIISFYYKNEAINVLIELI